MLPLRLLAVEDNIVQARLLRHQIGQLGYQLTGIAESASEAEAMFAELPPDLLLLDIHIKGPTDGVTLAQRLLKHRSVPVIFLTSDKHRSTFERALEVGPFAFLLKPYDEELLLRSIELAVAHFARAQGGETATLPDGSALVPGAMYVRENNRLFKVLYDDVLWLEADQMHVHLHTQARKFTVKLSLRELESRLPTDRFLRVRRNALVQLASIDKVDLHENVLWVRGQEVPIGGNYRHDLLNRLNQMR